MKWTDLKAQLDSSFRRMTKREFINFCQSVDGRTRVGGTTGKGRITAKRALAFLG